MHAQELWRTSRRQLPAMWSLDGLRDNTSFRRRDFAVNAAAKRTRYPVRGLRYWFIEQMLLREAQRIPRPLRIADVGVEHGQMLDFINGSTGAAASPLRDAAWDAISLRANEHRLRELGYRDIVAADITHDSPAPMRAWPTEVYDVVIASHILEHLHQPERAVSRLSGFLVGGGCLIVGVPALPWIFQSLREASLRRRARPFGHVSAFSSKRVRHVARAAGLQVELLSGAFIVRWSGSPLENSRAWMRLNLFFGSVLPSYAGEIYATLRKIDGVRRDSHLLQVQHAPLWVSAAHTAELMAAAAI